MLVCAALYEAVADILCQAGTKGPGRDSLEEHLFEVLAERGFFFNAVDSITKTCLGR